MLFNRTANTAHIRAIQQSFNILRNKHTVLLENARIQKIINFGKTVIFSDTRYILVKFIFFFGSARELNV